MHSCPDCGQACYCNGEIDDCEIESGADNCIHDCDPFDLADSEDPWLEDVVEIKRRKEA